MAIHQKAFTVHTKGKDFIEITRDVAKEVTTSDINQGLCNVFLQHTSASLTIMENADPSARVDLENFMTRLVPENADYFIHTAEGPDDMPSHIRSVLTTFSLNVPVSGGRLALGTWQGIFLWEHRDQPHSRKIIVSVHG